MPERSVLLRSQQRILRNMFSASTSRQSLLRELRAHRVNLGSLSEPDFSLSDLVFEAAVPGSCLCKVGVMRQTLNSKG